MLAKLSVHLKTIILFIALSILLFGFTFDLSNENPYILNYTPSSSDGRSTYQAESKDGASASGLVLPNEKTTAVIEETFPNTFRHPQSGPALKDGNATLLKEAPAYIKAIMNPEDTTFPRLDCPIPNDHRYHYLNANPADRLQTPTTGPRPLYFFALNLHQRASLLPSLFGAIVETLRFLGPQNCALSVIEGRSDDGTFEILSSLREEIECIGAKYYFNSSDIDPEASDRIRPGDRVKVLAELRNQALEPLLDLHHKGSPIDDTTIVFLNDVAICSEDILELIHQRRYQEADMVCGMDWTSVGPDPTFYDVWIARGMNGDTFFEIPPRRQLGRRLEHLLEQPPRARAPLDRETLPGLLLLERRRGFHRETLPRLRDPLPQVPWRDRVSAGRAQDVVRGSLARGLRTHRRGADCQSRV